MYEVIEHYKFTKILGYVILDNILINNTLVNVLIKCLKDIDMDWDLNQHYIYCFEHIMNLITLVFIYINLKNIFAINNAIR